MRLPFVARLNASRAFSNLVSTQFHFAVAPALQGWDCDRPKHKDA